MKRAMLALLIAACAADAAHATNRYYRNLEASSPNGSFQADAKSPYNQKGKRKIPFLADFTVTFRHTKTKTVVWRWRQGKNDASPVELIVTDHGRLIMLDAHCSYHVFDALGARKRVFSVLRTLPKQERDTFTDWTTAGAMWRQYSQQGLVTHQRKTYFYIRLYWGRTFIIDIDRAKLDTDARIARRVEQYVLRRTREFIDAFNGEYYVKCAACGGKHIRPDLAEAVFVVKKHGLAAGIGLLEGVLRRANDGHGERSLKRYLDRVEPKDAL